MQQVPVEAMTEAAILQHSSLRGLAQSIAEEYYILSAQQLEGYGQQTFAGKVDNCLFVFFFFFKQFKPNQFFLS